MSEHHTAPGQPGDTGVSDALLALWREQMQTPEGRELLAGILCRTMGVVVGQGCAKVCPIGRGDRPGLAEALDRAIVGADALKQLAAVIAATVEEAEYLAQDPRDITPAPPPM